MNRNTERAGDKVLKEMMCQGLSFVLFRPPGEKNSLWVQRKGKPINIPSLSELSNQKGFLFAPFHLTEKEPILLLQPDSKLEADEISDFFNQSQKKDLQNNIRSNGKNTLAFEDDKENYTKSFNEFVCLLKKGEFEKLVLSRDVKASLKNEELLPYSLFEATCSYYPKAYSYAFYSPISGFWLGASPELLLEKEEKAWRTLSLAGTMQYHDKLSVDDWSDKNIKEQELVTQYIASQLKTLNLIPEIAAPRIRKAGALAHLATEIMFSDKNEFSIGQLLDTIYPTPAICGIPKEEAKKKILETESCSRSYYSGIIGKIDPKGDSSLYVNLRCLSLIDETVQLYAGGGLLQNSLFEEEWQETENKLKTMQKLFL